VQDVFPVLQILDKNIQKLTKWSPGTKPGNLLVIMEVDKRLPEIIKG
jgi:hypothetical protein